MKKILFPVLAAVVLLTGCEEVIDYELEEGAKKVVIEGLITDEPGPYTVKISETKGYLDQDPNPGLSGATVLVQDNHGHIDTLVAEGPGVYRTTSIQGAVGNTYHLRVLLNGKEYSAQSTMRYASPIDSITYKYKQKQGFMDEGYYATFYFQEPAGKGDLYRFDIYVNNVRLDDMVVIDDEIYDGNYGDAEIGYALKLTDTIRVEMFSLDRPGYNFWLALQNLFYQSGSAFDIPPANAPTNLSNGAIGYFGASAKRTASKVIL